MGEDPGYDPDVLVAVKVRYFVNVFASLHLDKDFTDPAESSRPLLMLSCSDAMVLSVVGQGSGPGGA